MSSTKDYSSIQRKPDWLRVSRRFSPEQSEVEGLLKELGLNTVCKEANCPNYSDCFSRKTATFMIMGTRCTRNCRFCNVTTASPKPLDPREPANVARAVAQLELQYVVITSVTRDDLAATTTDTQTTESKPDAGALHFAKTIQTIRERAPQTAVEVLIPDFAGDRDALRVVAEAKPSVISHNMETVKALYPQVRKGADYQRSLALIEAIKKLAPEIRSKSGIMLGLGETHEQILELFDDLRAVGCELLTIGQYLAPSHSHYPVQAFLEPEVFEQYGEIARSKGFSFVASAPLVRSSYQAEEALDVLSLHE